MLHINGGGEAPVFEEESAQRGLEYYEDELHPALIDVDNDGRLDLAMSRLRGGSKFEFYFQAADHQFGMIDQAESGVDIERPGPTLWFDIDDDGDLDFYMPKGRGRVFRNQVGQDNNWLVLKLSATAPRDATGARVSLETSAGVQVREVNSGNGHYNTQHTRTLFFGSVVTSGASKLTIRWPDGEVEELGAVKANLRLEVDQEAGVSFF